MQSRLKDSGWKQLPCDPSDLTERVLQSPMLIRAVSHTNKAMKRWSSQTAHVLWLFWKWNACFLCSRLPHSFRGTSLIWEGTKVEQGRVFPFISLFCWWPRKWCWGFWNLLDSISLNLSWKHTLKRKHEVLVKARIHFYLPTSFHRNPTMPSPAEGMRCTHGWARGLQCWANMTPGGVVRLFHFVALTVILTSALKHFKRSHISSHQYPPLEVSFPRPVRHTEAVI